MHSSRLLKLLVTFLSVSLIAGAVLAPVAVMAAEGDATEETAAEETLLINAKFPSVTGPSDATFKFEIEFTYRTSNSVGEDFELTIDGPQNWLLYCAESTYKLDSQVSAIHLEPYSVKQPVVVVAVAPFWLYPEPGDYDITLNVDSENVHEEVDLTATITARYGMDADTVSGRLNTKTTAGKTSTFGINVYNTGTDVLDKVTFTSSKPSGIANEQWKVEYDPEIVEALDPGDSTEVQVSITPPDKTIAGDYMVTLKFDGDPDLSSEPPELDIRVSVATKTAWGIIGAVIVVLVVGGLVWAFKEFGRR